MDPIQAKVVAAATGSTMTALTSTSQIPVSRFYSTFPSVTPFDVVKTRLQTQPPPKSSSRQRLPTTACCQPANLHCVRQMSTFSSSLAQQDLVCLLENGRIRTERVNGFADAIRHVWRAEGMRGLWKGSGTTLCVTLSSTGTVSLSWPNRLIGVPSSTSYMLTYDYLLRTILPPLLPEQSVPLSAGVLARTAISTIASPLELIRTNLQATPMSPGTPNTLRSVLLSLERSVQAQGLRSLWRGLGSTLWRDVPFSGIYWASYEQLKATFARQGREGPQVAFVSGALSGIGAALLTSPMDVLKTRRQALIMASSDLTRVSNWTLLTRIIRNEGASAMFAGSTPRLAKIAPACGIMIACYEVRIRIPESTSFDCPPRVLANS